MKVKVLKKFRDKHTNEIHKKGEVLDITQKRFEEILKVDKLVEEVAEEPDAEPEVADAEEKPAKKSVRTAKKTAE